MSEKLDDRTVFSLLEVTKSIQKTISDRYTSAYWVKAEMNKLNFYKQSGHCFPELVEKQDGKIIAQMNATIWKDDFVQINSRFINLLNEPLKEGIKILFLASISFEPTYGLSLRIQDIDPEFTLGDLQREKQETINQLVKEGIYSRNKQIKMPLLPQRIAIISVESSKGYIDFLKVIDANPWGYKFFHVLFPSLLQGEKTIEMIIMQLNKIRSVIQHFDVVAIIRGGGADIGFAVYNNYQLAREIALFPIPVLTGIGHATNETVVELISNNNSITPTKLGEFLIQKFHNFSVPLMNAQEKIVDRIRRLIADEKSKIQSEIKLFRSVTENVLLKNRQEIKNNLGTLNINSQFLLKKQKADLDGLLIGLNQKSNFLFKEKFSSLKNMEQNIRNMDPINVLKRGYSLTYQNDKILKSVKDIKPETELKTTLFDGSLTSIVKPSRNKENHE